MNWIRSSIRARISVVKSIGLRPAALNFEAKRVKVDFPTWMVQSLDNEARKLDVTRQSLNKLWLADKLEHALKCPPNTRAERRFWNLSVRWMISI